MLYPAELLARINISSILLNFFAGVKRKGEFFEIYAKFHFTSVFLSAIIN